MASPMRAFSMAMSRRLIGSQQLMAGRAGMGLPVGTLPPPDKPLDESEELTWDDGTMHPEPAIDHILPHISDYGGLAMLAGGLSIFVVLGALATWNNKAARVPFAPREYPYDNLRVELGGDPEEA